MDVESASLGNYFPQVSYLYAMESGKKWFEEWFDSPYYHTLYKHRDSAEAENFLNNLIERIPMNAGSRVLDIACGKGRHSIYLNNRGFDVHGFDLSARSIQHDLAYENDRLHFSVHDMRNIYRVGYFDFAVNLFSSFGYFDLLSDNQRVFNSAATSLKKGGVFIFDYVNIPWAATNAMGSASEIHDGITFLISKGIDGDFIQKDISFSDQGHDYHFQERLRMFHPEQLKRMTEKAGLQIIHCYGSYGLEPFHPEDSKRLIIVSVKN